MKSKILLIVTLVLISYSFIFFKSQIKIKSTSPSPTPTPSQLITPTPTPTASPTTSPSPTAIPTIIPTTHPTISASPLVIPKTPSSVSSWTFDLSNTRVVTDTANDGECGNGCNVANLQTFVNKNNGFFGVNGTYFCPATYSECSNKTNSFDFPVFNTRLGRWINGGNLFWNSRSMIYFDGSGGHYKQNAKDFSGGLSAGIVNHPGLLDGGNIQIDENQSGLSDKQKARGTKVGDGEVLFILI